MTETSTVFFPDGTPRKIEFGINLARVDDSNFQDFRDQAANNQDAAIGLGLYQPRRNGGGGMLA